jgi:hypothetical protein
MVALLVDIRTTYALLLMPNILMDALQIARGELPWAPWRRLAPLLALAAMILLFLASSRMRVGLRMPQGWERWLGPLTGFVGGVLNGVTNVFSPIGAMYLLALQFEKQDFVKAIASIFLVAKISQLAASSRWGCRTNKILAGTKKAGCPGPNGDSRTIAKLRERSPHPAPHGDQPCCLPTMLLCHGSRGASRSLDRLRPGPPIFQSLPRCPAQRSRPTPECRCNMLPVAPLILRPGVSFSRVVPWCKRPGLPGAFPPVGT